MATGSRTRQALAASALAALAVAGCQAQLTPDHGSYKVTTSGSRVTFTNTASGGNERDALWASKQPDVADSTECARWVSGTGLAQNGLAFRIKADSGGWDSLVLERGVYRNGFWSFFVIYFHSGSNPAHLFDVGPSVDLGNYLGRDTSRDVFPLRICGQLVGTRLSFAVAKGSDPMVPVGTPGRGATFTVTNQQGSTTGKTGTYVAHVPLWTSTVVDSITINDQPATVTP